MPYRRPIRPIVHLVGLMLAAASMTPMAHARDYALPCALKDVVPSITTRGEAMTEVVPTIATISLGVVTERPKASDAASENASASRAIVADIKAQGIDARDIRTVSVTLTPVYDEIRDLNGRVTKRVPRGYLARNELSVRLKQIDKTGGFVARWIEKGANILGPIEFDVDQKEVKYEALRGEAVRDALRKATSYVNGLGIKLGRILSIAPPDYGGGPSATLSMARAAAPQDSGAAIAVEPGVQTLRTEVQVTWELAP